MDELLSTRLQGGLLLPPIGLGTYKMNGDAGATAVAAAIDGGYRLIDSAFNYENEGAVGEGIRRASVPREELIVTSKLPGRHHDYDEAVLTIEESLYRLGLEQIDLYLIHWPNPRVGKYVEAWQAMIDAQKRGLIKWIGVSNFLPEHIQTLEDETGVLPVVNQIQSHPYFPDDAQIQYNESKDIITEAWSPLGRGRGLLEEPVIQAIAEAHGATPAQVVLAWHVARGVVPIPKSSSLDRQLSNLKATDVQLTVSEVEKITGLQRPDGRMNDSDPATHEEF